MNVVRRSLQFCALYLLSSRAVDLQELYTYTNVEPRAYTSCSNIPWRKGFSDELLKYVKPVFLQCIAVWVSAQSKWRSTPRLLANTSANHTPNRIFSVRQAPPDFTSTSLHSSTDSASSSLSTTSSFAAFFFASISFTFSSRKPTSM